MEPVLSARAPVTILVVDDNPPTRYSTSRVLRSAGFTVIEAGTGQEAIAHAAAGPDLVVLDVNLPDMDGFQVCRELRALPRTARTPVVHLSATFIKDVDKVQGLEAGADGYLTHPVEPPVLIATVKAFLRARRAEDAMRESEAKFKAVFEQALNGIALISDDMIFIEVNPAMGATIGRAHDQIVGKHISAFSPVGYEQRIAELSQALETEGAWRGILPVLHADGRQIELEWSVSIHSLPSIRLAITADVTERKEIEAERERLLASERAARAEAERANRLKDDFLALLSHELRTPLNAIVGWSSILRKQHGQGSPDTVQGLEAIERNARVQAQLISDLLDISRITAGKIQLDRQWFDAAEAVEAALASAGSTARGRNIEIRQHIGSDVKAILWDPSRFQQVVWNLVDNAVKFSNPGGTVDVTLSESDTEVELSVRDAGRGISHDFLPYVFDRFRQEHSGTNRWHGGLGLGLAIVKQLVEAHGGTITVESAGEGHGATFTVRLPRPENAAAPVRLDLGGHGRPDLQGVRVLVVEDDADARLVIRRVLSDARAEVHDAADAETAVRAFEQIAPDILISDIGMPTQDGYDLIRRVRALGYDPSAYPAIALTAFAREEDRTRALEAGYQAHLTKPINAAQLIATASSLIEKLRDRNKA